LYRGKLHEGETLRVGDVAVTVTQVLDGGIAVVESSHDLLTLAEHAGSVPLPPYLHRDATANDTERYQTVFAKQPGSVAAPTASLNFTQELRDKLTTKGVKIVALTLHVGLGTFLPIRTDDIEQHTMHSEYFEIPAETMATIQQAKRDGRRICAVGTTVTRTLEFAAANILDGQPRNLSGEADIFMYPGYEFRLVNMLLTNFHAPRTTVLMLAAAFATWPHLHHAYDTAVAEHYNFLSYDDSMLIV
jgi:S-adenosylmethionine:tRNA ribosyltransferase-isomerase